MLGSGLRHVIGVAGHAIAGDFGKNRSAALSGVFEFFEHQNACAFAHHKAVAIFVPGTAGFFGIVIARGKRAHGGESANSHRRNGCLGAAGDHHIRVVVLNDAERISYRVGAGGAGGRRRLVRSLGAEPHGNMAGRKIDDGGRNKKRRNLARSAFEQCGVFAFDNVEPADAGPDVHAHALVVFWRDLQARHLERFIRGGNRQVDEASHLLDFFFFDEVQRIEVLDLGGDLAGEIRWSRTG